MNKYQNAVVVVAAVNAALMLLFPPFVDLPLQRGVIPNFESFYPIFGGHAIRRIHGELLTLELMFVVINGLAAWLALNRPQGNGPNEINHTQGVGLFALANLAVIFAFPPFEPYSSLLVSQVPSFDGFYFVLGDKRHRHFYVPLLYLEVILVTANAMAAWLLFNAVRRGEMATRDRIIALAGTLKPEQVMELTESLRQKVMEHQQNANIHQYGFGQDRRRRNDPRFKGPERRKGGDRRRKPRID